MPIEIKELTIKAYIDEGAGQPPASPVANAAPTASANNMETIVAACVEQVLQVLKDKEER
ncbi:DUF5908 family protein [Parafilimonas sp.]|uniref:DUF5908 family protein n=1 Tax=Parafilimonas sp. TaxID=1969739 RepID=UPI0039E57572